MNMQDSSEEDKNKYTISLTFKNVNESQFKDFHSIAQKVQEEKIFQGKKHYEKIMIISFTDQYYDLEDKYELMGNVEEKINEQLENLMSANDYNVKFGLMKRKETRIKVYQKKIDQDLVNIYMLIQYSQNKIENNIIQKIKRILNTDIYESKQMIRSQIYKNFYRPHTDIFQYPTQNRLLLNNFTYGMQKNLSSQFVTIWDLKDLKDLYENEKEGCQGVCFIEFVHKRNFKDEDKFFIFFTVKVLDYYIPFQLQVQVDSIYTCDLFQNPSVNDFVLFLKIVGFPKISKSFPIQNRFYYHYDFLNWERYSNFLLGKIQEQSNLIKMQILQHQVIQININKEYISENKDSFANIIKLFKEQNKVQFHDLNSKKSPLQGCQYRNYFDEGILSFLEILKNQYSKTKHFLKFQNILAKLVMTKVLDLHMLKDAQVQQKIRQNFKKATALFRLIHLNPQTYSIQNGDLNSFLDYWLSQSQSLKHINQQIKEFLWIPENFCLVNKIIITPSVSIYGNEELIPLSSNFKVSKFYEQDSIVYLLDEDFNLFDFEETDENFFKTIFEKHIKNNTIQIEEISIVYYINAITSRCLQRNCFFATQFEKIDDKQNTFLEYIQKSNVNFTQPVDQY